MIEAVSADRELGLAGLLDDTGVGEESAGLQVSEDLRRSAGA